jgi:ankyrin repeat protein
VHRAVHHGDLRILETVLRHGGDPNERGSIGGTETPLFAAARDGRADMADALVRYGADPNLRCGSNGTALQMAKPWPDVTNVLRGAGAKA